MPPRMVGESAHMSAAGETAFRVQAPNSLPRTTKVIALDSTAESLVRRLAASSSRRNTAYFCVARDLSGAAALQDMDGLSRMLDHELDDADLVVMVSGADGHAETAAAIGRQCRDRSVTTTSLVVGGDARHAALASTLAQLRPWSLMIVLANHDEYVEDMMTALGT